MAAFSMTRSRIATAKPLRAAAPSPAPDAHAGARASGSPSPSPSAGRSAIARAALAALAAWMLLESWAMGAAIVARYEGGWLAAATAAAILLSALVSSIAGFAFSAIAGSALAYLDVDPVHAVHMMVLCSIATQLYAVWNIRDSIRWRSLCPMIAAGAATIPLGVWLLLHIDAVLYGMGLGIFLTLYGAYVACRREAIVVRGNSWRDAAVGALGGLAGGLAGLPGSFVTIWCSMRGWDKLRQRSVYQPYILVMQLVTMVSLRCLAPLRFAVDRDLSVVPFALLGAVCGLAIFRRMTSSQFQTAVSALLVLSGIGLLARLL